MRKIASISVFVFTLALSGQSFAAEIDWTKVDTAGQDGLGAGRSSLGTGFPQRSSSYP
jgi:hypothetical protein